jgi:membrane protease YdiL (CAAX protease family)
MDLSLLFFGGIILVYIGAMIFIANQDDQARSLPKPVDTSDYSRQIAEQQRKALLRWMMYGTLAMNFVFGLLVLQIAFLGDSPNLQTLDVQLPKIDRTAAALYFALVLVLTVLGFLISNSAAARARLKRLTGAEGQYRPESSVHQVAVILALAFVSVSVGQLVLNGGLGGLAQDIETNGISLGGLIFQTVLMIVIAFLGVGLAIRRTFAASLMRLGLYLPTPFDLVRGLLAGAALFGIQLALVSVWLALTPQNQIAQQTAASDQFAQSFSTLPLAFLVSLSAGVSEEILFRGALQPVFGLWLTSLFFTLLHIQYTLTPASLILFVVALGLGLVRKRYNTNAAIVAHFAYNFIQLALPLLLTR